MCSYIPGHIRGVYKHACPQRPDHETMNPHAMEHLTSGTTGEGETGGEGKMFAPDEQQLLSMSPLSLSKCQRALLDP